MTPPTPTQRVTDAARELNESTRWGRMSLAASHAAQGARQTFLERRAQWGQGVRVLDVELSGMTLDRERRRATIQVDVGWTRANEAVLRATRLQQEWTESEGEWLLTREQRIAGDLGLFGEPVEVLHPEARDTHFESRSIR